jgi:hypothetical protein
MTTQQILLGVAVILVDCGIWLDRARLRGHARRGLRRLIVIDVLVTWPLANASATRGD